MMLNLSFPSFLIGQKGGAKKSTNETKSSFSFRTKASLTCLENEYFALPLDHLRAGDFRFALKILETT